MRSCLMIPTSVIIQEIAISAGYSAGSIKPNSYSSLTDINKVNIRDSAWLVPTGADHFSSGTCTAKWRDYASRGRKRSQDYRANMARFRCGLRRETCIPGRVPQIDLMDGGASGIE